MARNLLPGTLLDANHVTLWNMAATSLSRFASPIVTRLMISAGGQDTYAACQLGLSLVAWLLFELMIVQRPSSQLGMAMPMGEHTSLLQSVVKAPTTEDQQHAA